MKPTKFLLISLLGLFFFSACLNKTNTEQQTEIRFTQYMIEGKRLYLQYCSNCHQSEGQGFAKLYPPIKNSDFMQDTCKVICLIKNGIEGEIMVNGNNFNMKMPANYKLTDLEIAELTTFIYNQWSNSSDKIIATERVSKTLFDCSNPDLNTQK